jgi:CheY-like chemotaxis protein
MAEPGHHLRALVALEGPELEVVRQSLAELGVTADPVTTGPEIEAALERRRYDVFVLDAILADGESGYDVLARVRSTPATRHAPVLLLTGGERDSLSIVRGLHAGSADYVAKPLAPPALRERLRAALASAARPAPPSASPVPFADANVCVSGAVFATTELAGQRFDIVHGPRGGIAAFLLDASAHGTTASLVTRALRADLRSRLEAGQSTAACIDALERAAASMANDVVPSVAVGLLRFGSEGGSVEWVGAGVPPLVVADGEGIRLVAAAPAPLGLGGDRPTSTWLDLRPGSTLVVASEALGERTLGARAATRFRGMVARYGASLARASATELRALVTENAELPAERMEAAALVVAALL